MLHKSENPSHIAIIMDGNGRWAKSKGLPRVAGHKKGAEVAKEILQNCIELKIPYLTLYTFSSENWLRPADEVSYLMDLLRYYFKAELKNLCENNVKLNFIGNISQLPKDIYDEVKNSIDLTKENNGITLTLALSYGSREEITQAVLRISKDIIDKKLNIIDISEETIAKYLYTNTIPDPDLLIRTSGELRLSNYLLWQSAYTELFFTKILWPDFSRENLIEAIQEYKNRERRYGKSCNN